MAYNPANELMVFKRWRTERVLEIFAAGEPDRLHGTLALAIGSRESNLRNIVGGGFFDEYEAWHTTGVDRGCWQINEVYHAAWLKSVPGCISGEWAEAYTTQMGGAFPRGRVPGLTHACKKVRSILRYNVTYAASQGVPEADLVRVAVAGYNGGVGSAVRAYKDHGDPDRVTTGKDYSKDVLVRQRAIRKWLSQKGWG